jgi:hypothetical protein
MMPTLSATATALRAIVLVLVVVLVLERVLPSMTVNRRGHPIAIRVLEFGMRIGNRFKVSQSSFGVATLEDEDDDEDEDDYRERCLPPLAAITAFPAFPLGRARCYPACTRKI